MLSLLTIPILQFIDSFVTMNNYIDSILPQPSKSRKMAGTLPTIREEPSIFHMVNKYHRHHQKNPTYYAVVVNDLDKSGTVESDEEITPETTDVFYKIPL
jgi:hypothetical protein